MSTQPPTVEEACKICEWGDSQTLAKSQPTLALLLGPQLVLTSGVALGCSKGSLPPPTTLALALVLGQPLRCWLGLVGYTLHIISRLIPNSCIIILLLPRQASLRGGRKGGESQNWAFLLPLFLRGGPGIRRERERERGLPPLDNSKKITAWKRERERKLSWPQTEEEIEKNKMTVSHKMVFFGHSQSNLKNFSFEKEGNKIHLFF